MIVKQHATPEGKLLLAICDSDLLNKKFIEGNRQLDLSSSFYAGDEMEDEEILILLRRVYIINAVGEKTLNFLENNGFAVETAVVIDCVPHAQVVVEHT